MYMHKFLPEQGVGYQIAEHSQDSYGRHHPGNCSKTNKIMVNLTIRPIPKGENAWYFPFASCTHIIRRKLLATHLNCSFTIHHPNL